MNKQLNVKMKLVAPHSIAVLGASSKQGIGRAIIDNLVSMGYKGNLYAVNLRGEYVGNIKGYTSVMNIPDIVDTAIISLPSRAVLEVVEECGQKGVKGLICISAGFKEIGDSESELKLLDIVNRYGMCMIGPNCMGVVNTDPEYSMNATINPNKPKVGNIAMLTQSGALGAAFMDFADSLGVGFSIIVSTGNQADMNVCDFLEIVKEDKYTKVVLLYLEGIKEPERFRSIVRKMSKPVVVLKSGRTSAGAKAAGSHTGSLAGDDAIADAILRQSGCIRANSLEDAFLLTMTLSKIDALKGSRIGIVSNTGGVGILMADALTERGFELPPLPQEDIEKLKPILLPEASIRNPMDIVAPATPAMYEAGVSTMIESGEYDAVVVTCVPAATVGTFDIATAIGPTLKKSPIPIMTCFYGPIAAAAGKHVIQEYGIPFFDFPEKMAEMLEYIKPKENFNRTKRNYSFDAAKLAECKNILRNTSSKSFLAMKDAETLLSFAGIQTATSGYIETVKDIEYLSVTYPVVAKIDHPNIVHKSDVGGVRLNITDSNELKAVFNEFSAKFKGLRGVFVQEQVIGNIEMIVGAVFDSALGHAILVGQGGTMVELYKDVAFGHVPVTENDVAEMISRLKYNKVLDGYRGGKPADVPQLEDIVTRINYLLQLFPEIKELDINPLIFDGNRKHFIAVDFRIRVK